MNDYGEISIKTVENGWAVYPGAWQQGSYRPEPYVFESWDTLTGWLADNLADPKNS